MLHLAIFSPGFIQKIFTGQKSIDARFSKIRCAPFSSIEKGDLVLMKKSGGPIVGYFVAGPVKFYQDLTSHKLKSIVQKHREKLSIPDTFLQHRMDSNYLTLIEITKPSKFRLPVSVKKKNLSGWVCLGGTSQSQIQLF